jgi:excisionase family DNA binding protein
MPSEKRQKQQEFYSAPEVARILGLSRNAIFKRIKSGDIESQKIGRNYAISHESVLALLGQEIGENRKKELDNTVGRVIKEYGEVLKRLEAI